MNAGAPTKADHDVEIVSHDNDVRWSRTCGAIGRWPVADGSAQQEAAAHQARERRKEQDHDHQ